MEYKEYIETIKAMKEEIISILLKADLSNDRKAKKTMKTIDKMFNRIGKDAEDVLPKEILESYYNGVDEATKDLSNEGMESLVDGKKKAIESGIVSDVFKTQVHIEAIEAITDDTMLDFKAAIRTAKNNADKTIKDTLNKVKKDMQKGIIKGKARKNISNAVAKSFAEKGMMSFTTVDGKELPLDFYAETVTRTNLKRANAKGMAQRYKENDVYLVEVTGNTPTCDECAPYRDIVFSLDSESDEFPYIDENEFPLHPNCNCSLIPYVREYKSQEEFDKDKAQANKFDPTKDNRSKAQKQAYDKQQRLHQMNNYEKKRYAEISAILKDDAPKTLGAFKRMKRKNSDNYKKVLQEFREAMKQMGG